MKAHLKPLRLKLRDHFMRRFLLSDHLLEYLLFNTFWWWFMILAMNLNSAMKRLGLGMYWASRRMKAIRFSFINIPGRIVERSRELIIRLVKDHPAFALFLEARSRTMALVPAASG